MADGAFGGAGWGLSVAAAADAAPRAARPSFAPSPSFAGARPGLAFRTGPQGVGYYRDSVAAVAAAPVAAKRAAPARAAAAAVPLASQRDLVAAAFAGDDVVADFAEAKAAEVEAEAPAGGTRSAGADPPGWGSWASASADRRAAAAAAADAADAEARVAAAARRRDAGRAAVVVSERHDAKAARHAVPSVPHPFTSAAAYEASMRAPLGPDFNTGAACREMTRPPVITRAGCAIQPPRFTPAAARAAAEQNRAPAARRKAVAVVAGGAVKRSKR